jgi:tripartite motif-containing protein 71
MSSCPFVTNWGSLGSGDGQFNTPIDVAVDGSGNVYVADTGNNRIQKFTNTGTFLAKWGSPGRGNGQFESPGGLAVDRSGNVFVADIGDNRIQKFACKGGCG